MYTQGLLTMSTYTRKSSSLRGLVLLGVLNPISNIYFRVRGDIKLYTSTGEFLNTCSTCCAIEIPLSSQLNQTDRY